VLKTIARSRFGAGPAFGIIGRDERGEPVYGFVDPGTRSVTPYKPPPLRGPASREISSLDSVIAQLAKAMEGAGESGRDPSSVSIPASPEIGPMLRSAGMSESELSACDLLPCFWTDLLLEIPV
jgi:hypothetical protein